MNRMLILTLALLTAAIAEPVSAAVIERDWKVPGDGLLTYDDVNQREWLDLPLQFDLPVPRYDSVMAELAPGGMFAGFTVAGRNDVAALAVSAGIDISNTSYGSNAVPTGQLIELLGATFSSSPTGFRTSRALINEVDPQNSRRFAGLFDVVPPNRAGLMFASRSDGISQPTMTVFLFRTVPEPATFSLLATATTLCALELRRETKRGRSSVGAPTASRIGRSKSAPIGVICGRTLCDLCDLLFQQPNFPSDRPISPLDNPTESVYKYIVLQLVPWQLKNAFRR